MEFNFEMQDKEMTEEIRRAQESQERLVEWTVDWLNAFGMFILSEVIKGKSAVVLITQLKGMMSVIKEGMLKDTTGGEIK